MINEEIKEMQLRFYNNKEIPIYPSYRLSIERDRIFFRPSGEEDRFEFKTFVKKGDRAILVRQLHNVCVLEYKNVTPLEIAERVKERFDSECAKVFEKGLFNDVDSIKVE